MRAKIVIFPGGGQKIIDGLNDVIAFVRGDGSRARIIPFRRQFEADGRPDIGLLTGADLADAHPVIDPRGVFACGPKPIGSGDLRHDDDIEARLRIEGRWKW